MTPISQAISSAMQLPQSEREQHVRAVLKQAYPNTKHFISASVSNNYSMVRVFIRIDPHTVLIASAENGCVKEETLYNEFFDFDGRLVHAIYHAYEQAREAHPTMLEVLSAIEAATLNYRMHNRISFLIENGDSGYTIKWVEGDEHHIVTLHSFMEYRAEKA